MENYESHTNIYSQEGQSGSKSHSLKERGGLIPVTSNIIKKAEISSGDIVEYDGVSLIDVTAVGYVVDYQEMENKIIITLYDYTGIIDIVFFNRLDNTESINLDKLKFESKRIPVQIFGTLKVFKGEKIIQGAKLIPSNSNNVLYHKAHVIHSWLYLTRKLKENIPGIDIKNDDKTYPKNNNYSYKSEKKGGNDEEEAIEILNNYSKKENVIKEGKLEELFRKFGARSKEIINKLIDNNKLIEIDGGYEIIS